MGVVLRNGLPRDGLHYHWAYAEVLATRDTTIRVDIPRYSKREWIPKNSLCVRPEDRIVCTWIDRRGKESTEHFHDTVDGVDMRSWRYGVSRNDVITDDRFHMLGMACALAWKRFSIFTDRATAWERSERRVHCWCRVCIDTTTSYQWLWVPVTFQVSRTPVQPDEHILNAISDPRTLCIPLTAATANNILDQWEHPKFDYGLLVWLHKYFFECLDVYRAHALPDKLLRREDSRMQELSIFARQC